MIFSNDQDINDIELIDLQNERCPRISANDVIYLKNKKPEEIVIVDIRNHLDFKRAHIKDSINIPFTTVSLSDVRLESLGVQDIEGLLANRIVVVVNISHENSILVCIFILSKCSIP